MALKKEIVIWGFNTTNYAKINTVTTVEESSEPKLYTATVWVSFYTNDNKEHLYESTNFSLQGLMESELSLDWLYSKLKAISDFDWYINS